VAYFDDFDLYAKIFYGEPGERYSVDDILAVPEGTSNPDFPFMGRHLKLSAQIVADDPTTFIYSVEDTNKTCAGKFIYPFSCDYRIERGQAGAFSRRMSVFLSDGSADTNKMGRVVFKQMIIHSNAPSPQIYLSASPDIRLYRASTGMPITFYNHGESWTNEIEDITDDLRSGDLAILVEGILPSSGPNQTADNYADGQFHPPGYGGIVNPTSQGDWGTYVGLYCKDAVK